MNSIGEVLGQSGDATGALVEFQRSSELIWGNPMPYLNAARIYQQLGQSSACEEHLKEALKRDSTLVLAYVDGAQLCLQASVGNDRGSSALGRDRMALRVASTKQASAFVNAALLLSRHISEVVVSASKSFLLGAYLHEVSFLFGCY
jgi:tetratricopeptide (TPR) repeat protein